jgi:hypothetical protein
VIFADGHFTMESLSRLEQIGITSLREVEAYKSQLQSVVGMDEVELPINNSSSLLEMWVQGRASLRPTWRHFFWALREIKLNHLADQIEASLTGVAGIMYTLLIKLVGIVDRRYLPFYFCNQNNYFYSLNCRW